ncbi:adapter molecule Crk isoform X3 [Drosophila sechellia]|uniref:Adapter molecule Crk isoform X3 n=1 Tax=Drosophila mauritiana TaxID=7226 RepID=A0A6P8KLX0_DROMA|nr:adapter molecule Crk isoform X3 [Drosophila sechellia]XP_033168202.1 adapter molecule Crk isoform X3 [Drosophila mauritiana]
MDTFDVSDRNSWYFGPMSRQDATEVLMNERERGVFLVRDSNSIAGDYVLCVSMTIIWMKMLLTKTNLPFRDLAMYLKVLLKEQI